MLRTSGAGRQLNTAGACAEPGTRRDLTSSRDLGRGRHWSSRRTKSSNPGFGFPSDLSPPAGLSSTRAPSGRLRCLSGLPIALAVQKKKELVTVDSQPGIPCFALMVQTAAIPICDMLHGRSNYSGVKGGSCSADEMRPGNGNWDCLHFGFSGVRSTDRLQLSVRDSFVRAQLSNAQNTTTTKPEFSFHLSTDWDTFQRWRGCRHQQQPIVRSTCPTARSHFPAPLGPPSLVPGFACSTPSARSSGEQQTTGACAPPELEFWFTLVHPTHRALGRVPFRIRDSLILWTSNWSKRVDNIGTGRSLSLATIVSPLLPSLRRVLNKRKGRSANPVLVSDDARSIDARSSCMQVCLQLPVSTILLPHTAHASETNRADQVSSETDRRTCRRNTP